MLDECLPADPRVLTGYTQTLMAQLSLDSGLPPEFAFWQLEKTKASKALPPWLQLRRGVLYREAGEPERALRLLNSLHKTDLDQAEVYYQRALCWMDLEQWVLVIQDLTSAIVYYHDDAFTGLLGEAMIELGQIQDALALYETVWSGLQLHESRIYVYEKTGRFDLAIREANEALRLFPKEVGLLGKRAQLRSDAGDPEGARGDYSVAIALDRNAEYLAGRAVLDLESGRLEEAAKDAELAVSLEPNNEMALRALAMVLDAQGKLEASARFWERYTRASEQLQGLLFHAEVLNRLDKIEECDQLLARYRKIRPGCWEGKYYQMAFLRTRSEHEAAETLAQDALKADPGEFSLLFERAQNLLAWERYEEAAEQCLELRKRFPEALEIREFWVEILVETSRYQLALEAVDQLLSQEQSSGNEVLHCKANILAKLKRWKESLQILNALLESEPDNPDYYEDRAQAFLELDRYDESWQDANRGLEIDPERTWLRIHRACMNVHRGALEDTASEAAEVLKEDLEYQHRLFCRALWLGARVGERLRKAFSPISNFFRNS